VSFGGSVLFSQDALTLSEANPNLGHLKAYARASATSSPEQGGGTGNIYGAAGTAIATAFWHDVLTVEGTPNEDGLVLLRFSIDLDGQVMRSGHPVNQGYIRAGFQINDDENHSDELILFVDGPGEEDTTIGFAPGTHLQVYGSLSAAAVAVAGRAGQVCNPTFCGPGPFYAEGSTSTDDSARFYIDVVTPGDSYSSESGHSYETPDQVAVPEPSAWLVLASGLLGLATFRGQRGAGRA
jgi:hypothetical protein